jgi:nitrosocyanin
VHTSTLSRSRRFFLPALLGAGLVLSGCGGHDTVHRTISAVDVSGGAGFSPTPVTVDKDDNVVLTVANSTAKVHGFTIEGYGIQKVVNPGPGIQVKFKSTKPGTFKIYCQLHPTHQVATLVVQ